MIAHTVTSPCAVMPVLASRRTLAPPRELGRVPTHYLSSELLSQAFVFPPDSAELPVRVNRIENQALVAYYGAEWERWN